MCIRVKKKSHGKFQKMTLKIVILILEIIAQCLMLFPWSLFFLKKRGREVQSFLWQTLSKINIYENALLQFSIRSLLEIA